MAVTQSPESNIKGSTQGLVSSQDVVNPSNSLPNVAYFSMEMAIDQKLAIYSGGLGFLAGSHMRSAAELHMPVVGVTMLWACGYGNQQINAEGKVEIVYEKKTYPFLKDTGVVVDVTIFGEVVKVKAMKLEPDTFGSVPVILLTTDIEENKPEHRALTNKLYDGEQKVRISQEIILGIGGYKALKALNQPVDVVHLNEGHALPALFEMLREHGGNVDEVRKRAVFTTHTPVAAGNETHPAHLLNEAGFFADTHMDEAMRLGGQEFSLTVAALKMCRIANGVSQLHGHVANNMWNWVEHRCPIVAITNAVNTNYWQDPRIAAVKDDNDKLLAVKREFKVELFKRVKEETGKTFDPDVLTIVWARRFTEYKRAALLFQDLERIQKLFDGKKIQVIYSGKFHPLDKTGQETFNKILEFSRKFDSVAVMLNYGLELSGLLKRGSDVWLNNPLRPLEASGTSGMSANMNGSIHVSTSDGWAVEGTYDHINGYIINEHGQYEYVPVEERNVQDYESMMDILENKVIPLYYHDKQSWAELMRRCMEMSTAYFDSHRMAVEYMTRLYKPVRL